MAIEIIDTLVQKNDREFPIVDANDVAGGYYQVDTIAQRDAIPEVRRKNGMLVYVSELDDGQNLFQYKNGKWVKPKFAALETNTMYIGDKAPEDTSVLWVDTVDEDLEGVIKDSPLLQEFTDTVKDLREGISGIEYAFTKELDSGEFADRSITDSEEGESSGDGVARKEGNINIIRIKRGTKIDLPVLQDGELGYCRDTKELYIGNNGNLDLIGKVGGLGSGTNNITAEYVQLISPNKTSYRISVSDSGDLQIYDAALDEIEDPTVDQAARFAGLIINQIYGGGSANSEDTPVSHGFIELYNNTDNDMNLKGLSIHYGENLRGWQTLNLRGLVPARCSFLIRCAQHTNPNSSKVRCRITNYDMSWDIPLTDKGMKVYLGVGRNTVTVANPFSADGGQLLYDGYIDMLSAGGEDVTRAIDGYESRYGNYMSKNCAVHRKDFADTNDNLVNAEPLDYRTCDVAVYGPRCSKDGRWNVYYNKIQMDANRPNMINIAYGKDGHTTRTFTWQTYTTNNGYLKYRKKGEEDFIVVETERTSIQHEDCDATMHSVIIRDLQPGTYQYQAGEEGKWSDLYEFEVIHYGERDPIKFVQTSDQQGWTEEEYMAWKYAIDQITKDHSDMHFMLNTGDISQNAIRSFEWRYYYEYAKHITNNKVHMMCIGNNDRVNKTDSRCFKYYGTFEDAPYTSCYSFDIGMVHFISLNSEELYEEQYEWYKQEILANKGKRWIVVYMHVAPYTIVRMKKVQGWAPIFEEYPPDLVLCGHHHSYSRSHPMKADEVNQESGVPYVMCQATGYKLSGREKPIEPAPNWYAFQVSPGQPSYIEWEITWDKIIMKSYRVDGIMPIEFCTGNTSRYLFDSHEFLHRDLRANLPEPEVMVESINAHVREVEDDVKEYTEPKTMEIDNEELTISLSDEFRPDINIIFNENENVDVRVMMTNSDKFDIDAKVNSFNNILTFKVKPREVGTEEVVFTSMANPDLSVKIKINIVE